MQIKKIIFICSMVCCLPLYAYAENNHIDTVDISVTNNTDFYGTGHFAYSVCSSHVPGGDGIIKPHQSGFKIPGSFIKLFCGNSDCDATIYASQDCSGPKKGVVTVNANKGVVKIENYDKEHFNVVGSGNQITINQTSRSFIDWMKSLF